MTIELVDEDTTRNILNQRRHEDRKNVGTKHKGEKKSIWSIRFDKEREIKTNSTLKTKVYECRIVIS